MEESIPSSVVLKLHIKFLCRPDLLAASQIVLKLALKLLFLLKQQSLPGARIGLVPSSQVPRNNRHAKLAMRGWLKIQTVWYI